MDITRIVVVGIIGAVVCMVINQYKPEYTIFVGIATGVVILIFLMPSLLSILEYLENIIEIENIDTKNGGVVLKALGISVITQLASETCKDCGQNSIASKIELGGKISILAISVPLFVSILETLKTVINL